jgi:hypothetical protein
MAGIDSRIQDSHRHTTSGKASPAIGPAKLILPESDVHLLTPQLFTPLNQ